MMCCLTVTYLCATMCVSLRWHTSIFKQDIANARSQTLIQKIINICMWYARCVKNEKSWNSEQKLNISKKSEIWKSRFFCWKNLTKSWNFRGKSENWKIWKISKILKKNLKIWKTSRNLEEISKSEIDFFPKTKFQLLFSFFIEKICFSRFRWHFILSTPSWLKVTFVILPPSTPPTQLPKWPSNDIRITLKRPQMRCMTPFDFDFGSLFSDLGSQILDLLSDYQIFRFWNVFSGYILKFSIFCITLERKNPQYFSTNCFKFWKFVHIFLHIYSTFTADFVTHTRTHEHLNKRLWTPITWNFFEIDTWYTTNTHTNLIFFLTFSCTWC